MSDEELVKRLREDDTDFWHCEAADRIEALTEQLKAARADAKEAEAYAEELERERNTLRLVIAANIEKHRSRAEAAEAKLAKSAEALQAFKAFDDMPARHKRPDVFEVSVRRKLLATLAEIKGEKE
jgi:hypothetical protein